MRGAVLVSAGIAGLLVGAVAAWVAPDGRTILTDRPEPPVEGATRVAPGETAGGFERGPVDRALGDGASDSRDSSREDRRIDRIVRGALADLERDPAGAVAEIRRLHARHPSRPDVALALADVERARGRLESARRILVELLENPSASEGDWRPQAERELRKVAEEIDVAALDGAPEVRRPVDTPNFTLSYDHRLAGRAYGERVAQLMEQVRTQLARSLGRTLPRRLEIRLYTRGQYLEAYQHRFGFATVGFFDGIIHVVAARHPRGELLALLTHEYSHALFEDALGGHQPFFLNEGIAEREEERVRGREGLTRGEWWKLLEAIRTGDWIPFGDLVTGFDGLEGADALLAYLESRAAIEVLESAGPGSVSRWLHRCASGEPWERALVAVAGLDGARLDDAVQTAARDRFLEDPLRASR